MLTSDPKQMGVRSLSVLQKKNLFFLERKVKKLLTAVPFCRPFQIFVHIGIALHKPALPNSIVKINLPLGDRDAVTTHVGVNELVSTRGFVVHAEKVLPLAVLDALAVDAGAHG